MDSEVSIFLSYLRIANDQDYGSIANLRMQLLSELRVHGLGNVSILFDQDDIQWGDRWAEFVESTPSHSHLFMPIIVEGYFQSKNCLREYRSFRSKERTLKSSSLIIPIYYDDCRPSSEEVDGFVKEAKEDVFSRNYFDWRRLRFEESNSQLRREAIRDMAFRISTIIKKNGGFRPLEEKGYKTTFEIESNSAAASSFDDVPVAEALIRIKDKNELNTYLRYKEQSRTQQNIVLHVYLNIPSNESLTIDAIYNQIQNDQVVPKSCTLNEFVFRLRDLAHAELISIKTVGPRTTTVSKIELVKSTLKSAGLAKSS